METIDLGADVDYLEAWAMQRRIHAEVADGLPPVLLLLEHASVYTAGSRTEQSERPTNGAPVVDVDRGGKITWHGPGQLVAYPIVRLPEGVGVADWVRRLEQAMIEVFADFGVTTGRIAGRAGVWLAGDASLGTVDRKIAQVGVRVASRTSMHGVALNVAPDMAAFQAIVPCGIADAGVTSMALELASPPSVADVATAFAARLEPLLAFEPFDLGAPIVAARVAFDPAASALASPAPAASTRLEGAAA